MPLNYFCAPGFFLVCLILIPTVSAENLNIYFKASPLTAQLRPFSEPATLSLLVTEANGKPLAVAWLEVRLDAPPARLFSTDFPLIEGTQLLDMRIPLKAGKAEWKYLFPIRGEYQLFVDVLTLDGTKTSKTFGLRIREHRDKWLVLTSFTAGLLVLGFVAGRIFTRAPRKAHGALLLAVAISLVTTESIGAEIAADDTTVGRLEVDVPAVGKPAGVRWTMLGGRARAKRGALLSLMIIHVEKRKAVFAIERMFVEGEYSMKFQFVDGAEHRVVATAELPDGQRVRAEQVVAVSGGEPPLSAMVPALGLFLGAIAVGLGAGRWSRRRATPS